MHEFARYLARLKSYLRLHVHLVAEVLKENRLRLSAVKRRHIGRVRQKGTERPAAKFNPAWRWINAIGAHANQFRAAAQNVLRASTVYLILLLTET